MNGKTVSIVVIILIVLAGAWYFLMGPGADRDDAANMAPGSAATTSATPTADGVTVSYTNQGFSPASVNIVDGDSVTWTNNSSENLWVASDPHPAHSGYDGTTREVHCAAGYTGATPLDSCTMITPGASWTFVFKQVGSWSYHNHADDAMRGTVVVAAATASTSAAVHLNVQ